MQISQWSTLKAYFRELSELPPLRQQARLAAIAREEPALATELSELLRAEDPQDESITGGVQSLLGEFADAHVAGRLGALVGSYRITEHLAHGGMGDVFLGERADGTFEQRVAIKLMRAGFRSEEDLRRFDAERRLLARLDSPGIARVLDGGSMGDGTPYLVMEYVDGVPIDTYCTEQALSLRARISLFREVCSAVEFAHRNLVVHRDLKPSNILVTREGQAKLLDFGIAKPIDDGAGDATEASARAMTPDFASPEQVLGQPITTSSDVYSLGVLLYLLTTGLRPYSTAGLRASERETMICEADPQRPSVRRRSPQDGHPEPVSLRGDVDAIVIKALRKQPGERYSSVQALSDDLLRYLDGAPVAARDRRWAYVLQKFLRRHALAVSGGLLGTLGLAGAIAYHTHTVTLERDRAQLEARRAQSVANFMTEIFAAPNPEQRGVNVSARAVVDAGAERLERTLADQPDIRAALLTSLGEVYESLGEPDAALARHTEARELYESLGDRRGVARALAGLGAAYGEKREFDSAIEHYLEAVALEEQLSPAGSLDLAHYFSSLGDVYKRQGDFPSAEAYLRAALERYRQLGEQSSEAYGVTLMGLGSTRQLLGDYAEAEQLLREAVKIIEARVAPTNAKYSLTLFNLASALVDQRKYAEAEQLYLEVLELEPKAYGPDHPALDNAMVQLGSLYRETGQLEEAERYLQRAVAHSARTRGRRTFDTGYNLHQLSVLQHKRGDLSAAQSGFAEVVDIYAEVLGEDSPYLASVSVAYARLLTDAGKPDAALARAQAALRAGQASLPEGHWLIAQAGAVVGIAQRDLGAADVAQASLAESFAQLSEVRPGDAGTIAAGEALAELYAQAARYDEAARVREAITAQRKAAATE
ncbi:MAG: serine/threonine-protein kinase [Pseudomonadota bacterium]